MPLPIIVMVTYCGHSSTKFVINFVKIGLLDKFLIEWLLSKCHRIFIILSSWENYGKWWTWDGAPVWRAMSVTVPLTAVCRWHCSTLTARSVRWSKILNTDWKRLAVRLACSEREHSADVFGIGSNDTSCIAKSWACASVAFLAGIILWSVDSIFLIATGGYHSDIMKLAVLIIF